MASNGNDFAVRPWLTGLREWLGRIRSPRRPQDALVTDSSPPSVLGIATLRAAIQDLGKGEQIRNNAGPYVWSLTGRKTSGPWCAAAVYTWINRATSRQGWRKCPVQRSHSARRLVQNILDAGGRDVTGAALPGDVVLSSRKRPWQGHVDVVDSAENGHPHLVIGGNVGKFPALVRRRRYRRNLVMVVRLP